MNCDTYLSMLTTLPMEELAYGDARLHTATCRDCDRVTRVVAERERSMIAAYGALYAPVHAGSMTARAMEISRRRTIALFYRIGLGAAMAATVLFLIVSRRAVSAPSGRVSETFRLQCLSSDQALEVLAAVRSPDAAISAPATTVGVIKVSASPAEMERLRSVLDRYDAPAQSQCDVRARVPKVIQVP